MNSKRGISPLIATVLLIGFTVALAAVIMTWALGYFQETTESVNLETEKYMLCTNKLRLEVTPDCQNKDSVTIENNGEMDVASLKVAVKKPSPPAPVVVGAIPSLLSQEVQIDLNSATAVRIMASIRGRNNATLVNCDVQEFPIRC